MNRVLLVALKAAVMVADGDAERFWAFVSYVYERQKQFANEAFDDRTRQELFQLIQRWVTDFTGTETGDRLQDSDLEQATKEPIRVAISQGIWSTPTFLINGGEADQLSSSSSLDDWKAILDPLL